jgi:hypothetical protein
LAKALQHTSLPLVRKDDLGNMFAVAVKSRSTAGLGSRQPAAGQW